MSDENRMELRKVFADSVRYSSAVRIDPQVFVEVWVGNVGALIWLEMNSRSEADEDLRRAVGELIVRAQCRAADGRSLSATLDLGWNLLRARSQSDAIRLGIAALDVAWNEVYERVCAFETEKKR